MDRLFQQKQMEIRMYGYLSGILREKYIEW